MQIRKATQSDKDIIAGFQIEMALETENLKLDLTTVKKGVNAVLNDVSKGTYFLAENNGEVLGSLLITYEWSDWRNGTIWWIQSVFITPKFRRSGVFSAMYKHIKALVEKDELLQGIRLYVDNTNIRAQETYGKLGMNGDHYSTFEWMKNF